ncbi:TetR/AcrR family transcriptional regulator [Actinomyces mediterranea]|uniref:TetR/AcrR family transcriptional regulator n=1 Tax=Actinomyces mediterranea TaxID=1871028 RepID=UPI0009FB6C67|nr:TetR/AcrR family transcriptional regulator [Actinomyces mediterranea]
MLLIVTPGSDKPRRRPRGEADATRRDILRAAMDVFGQRGFHNGSLQEIGEQVGMTHSGVLHHFHSKHALLLEVIRFRDQSDLDEIEGHQLPMGEALFSHFKRTVRMNEERPGVVQAYAVLCGESVTEKSPAKKYFQERFHRLRRQVGDALADMGCTALTDDELTVAAASLIGAMDGIQTQWLLAPDEIDLVATTDFVIDSILTAAAVRHSELVNAASVNDNAAPDNSHHNGLPPVDDGRVTPTR